MRPNLHVHKKTGPFVVMAKPVGSLCNMRCSYCYYLEAENHGSAPSGVVMSDTILEQFIKSYMESCPGPAIQFTWHGGEPALAGIGFYERAAALQKRYLPAGWECWNNLQTNGLLLDDEWCAFLSKNRFDVGLSLDGYGDLHDQFRKDISGGGTYERCAAAVRRLQAHGIQPDLLCTVTSNAAENPLTVYQALKDLNTGWIQFIPIVRRVEGKLTPDSVTGAAYGKFLCDIFDQWAYHDLGKVDVQLFAETAVVAAGGAASLCWMAPTCGRVLIVEKDGSVYSCDHFVDSAHKIGHIDTAALSVLVDLPIQQKFGRDKMETLPSQCLDCPWLALCGGGCPKDRFTTTRSGQPGLNHLCDGLRQFFDHAQEPLKQLMALKQSGQPPQAIMAELRRMEALPWKGVGRNDPCPCGSGKKAKHCCWHKRPL